jgi:hypothetical protein
MSGSRIGFPGELTEYLIGVVVTVGNVEETQTYLLPSRLQDGVG